MLEFTKLQQNAKHLPRRLSQYNTRTIGCFSFFSMCMPQLSNDSLMDDAITIGLLADSLAKDNDALLIQFLENLSPGITSNEKYLEHFKSKVLKGMYLKVWADYNTLLSSHMNDDFVDLLQADLDVGSPDAINQSELHTSLKALSQYASYAYQNQHHRGFFDLNLRFGQTIQVEIHGLRHKNASEEFSWYGVFSALKSTLGMNNMS